VADVNITPSVSQFASEFSKLIGDDVAWMADVAKDLNIAPEGS